MLNFVIEFLIINTYRDIITFIKIISLREKIYKVFRVYDVTIVLSYINILILVRLRNKCKINLFKKHNLIFMLIKLSNYFELNKNVLNYIINVNMCAI